MIDYGEFTLPFFMNGNLEPDERVLDDSVRYPGGMLGQLALALEKLGWEYGDEVDVEIGGTSVSGIDVGEVYNRSGSLRLVLVSTTKMPSSSLRINPAET